MMTHQEVFNIVYSGLRAQNWKASHKGGNEPDACMFRNPEGLKCAIGQLIPEDKYNPEMERLSGQVILGTLGILEYDTHDGLNVNSNLVSDLIRAHDYAKYNGEHFLNMKQALEAMAKVRGLEIPE